MLLNIYELHKKLQIQRLYFYSLNNQHKKKLENKFNNSVSNQIHEFETEIDQIFMECKKS